MKVLIVLVVLVAFVAAVEAEGGPEAPKAPAPCDAYDWYCCHGGFPESEQSCKDSVRRYNCHCDWILLYSDDLTTVKKKKLLFI